MAIPKTPSPYQHKVCRIDCEDAANAASQRGVYKKLSAWKTSLGTHDWYEVRDECGEIVWQGAACCKWHAKCQAYEQLVLNA